MSRFVKILLAALVVEVLAILALVIAVAILGPSDPAAAAVFAVELGSWFGPLAGFVLTLLAAWWMSARLPGGALQNGLLLGAAVAFIDVAILAASGASFQTIFLASNVGRILAGGIGGWLAQRGSHVE